MSIRLLVVVSDQHVGSTIGLLRPGYSTAEGNEIGLNDGQRWLWEAWERMRADVRKVIGKSDAALILNGDATEGVHHGTTQVVSNDPADHLGAAIYTLTPLAEMFGKVYVTRGTECHTHGMEGKLGAAIGAEKCPATGNRAADEWHLDVAGVPISVRHHISATSRAWTLGSGLGIHLAHEQLTACRVGHPRPRVLVRAHRHQHGYAEVGDSLIAVTGPWQLLTRYAHKAVPGSISEPTAVVLETASAGSSSRGRGRTATCPTRQRCDGPRRREGGWRYEAASLRQPGHPAPHPRQGRRRRLWSR